MFRTNFLCNLSYRSLEKIQEQREDEKETMKSILFVIFVCGCMGTALSLQAEQGEMTDLFPEFEEWKPDGQPVTYTPATLFEYINGAAEVYLSYGFQELATLTYDNAQDRSVTIDIYRHNSPNNGFGIYSQEKPLKSTFLSIGAQGYYEPGMINFFKERYYVKILSFGLGDEDSSFLRWIAAQIAERIPGEQALPKPLLCFPEKGKVEHSERFVAENFLGHSFLHSAFLVDYVGEDESFRPFIIEGAKEEEAETMLKAYLELLEKNGIDHRVKKGVYRFQDPYFDQTKGMHLKQEGKYIWGLFAGDASAAASYLQEVENRLKGLELLE
jgi:hypothetical protein